MIDIKQISMKLLSTSSKGIKLSLAETATTAGSMWLFYQQAVEVNSRFVHKICA